MTQLPIDFSPSLNNDVPEAGERAKQRVLPKEDLLTRISLLQEHIGWNYNGVLAGVTFMVSGDVWQCYLKAEMASGPKIAYFTSQTLYQLVDLVHWYVSKGHVEWHKDKRPVRVSKRKGVYRRKRNS